jgi:hypothetical protein
MYLLKSWHGSSFSTSTLVNENFATFSNLHQQMNIVKVKLAK